MAKAEVGAARAAKRRVAPSRAVLLAVHAAAHSSKAGFLPPDQRGARAVDLWRKLTGDEVTPSQEIIAEAAAASDENAHEQLKRRWRRTLARLPRQIAASSATRIAVVCRDGGASNLQLAACTGAL